MSYYEKKIRVLVYGFTYNMGGIESFYMNYYRKLDKNKFQIDFIKVYEKIAYEDELLSCGSRMIELPKYNENPIEFSKELKRVFKENKYDVFHANMLTAANISHLKIAKSANVPIIIAHSHNGNCEYGTIKRILHNINKKRIARYANRLLACSEAASFWMFRKKDQNKVTIVNNAIDLEKFSFNSITREKIRNELHIDNKYVIGHVGRFNTQKNHKFLIEVFFKYSLINKDAVLLLIGEGNLEQEIKDRASELGIENKVFFLGKKMDTYKYYSAMDCFVLPSLYEGLPVVGIEAQASGVPCIFSDNITKELQINDNVFWIGVDEADYLFWTECLKNICDSGQRCGNTHVLDEKYNINTEIEKIEQIYCGYKERGGKGE